MMRLNVVALLPLEADVDEAVAAEVFDCWTRHLLPLLDDGWSLGVARPSGVVVADDAESLQAALHGSVGGLAAGDLAGFAVGRVDGLLAALQDPQVTALWLYNGGAPVGRDRPEAIQTMAAVVQAVKERLPQFQLLAAAAAGAQSPAARSAPEAADGLWQKPLLGFSYGAAVTAILGIAGICRPVHCPLAKDLPTYTYYPPDLRSSQLQAVAWALKGELQQATFPPGLEVHSAPAAAFARGQGTARGFVVAGLVQIVHGILTRYMPPGVPIILVVELLDFGDEFDLLLDIAQRQAAGTLQLQVIFFGQHTVNDIVRWNQMHQVRQRMAALCPALPILGGLPLGHGPSNCVLPMGWASVHCEAVVGRTVFSYHLEGSPKPGDHHRYVMLPAPGSVIADESPRTPASLAETVTAPPPTRERIPISTLARQPRPPPPEEEEAPPAPPDSPGEPDVFYGALLPERVAQPDRPPAAQPPSVTPSAPAPTPATAGGAPRRLSASATSTPATRHQAALRRLSRRSSLPATLRQTPAAKDQVAMPHTTPNAAMANPAVPAPSAVQAPLPGPPGPATMPTMPVLPPNSSTVSQVFVGPTTYVMSEAAVALLRSLTSPAGVPLAQYPHPVAPFPPYPGRQAPFPAAMAPDPKPSLFARLARRLSAPASLATKAPPRPYPGLPPNLPPHTSMYNPLFGPGSLQRPMPTVPPTMPFPTPAYYPPPSPYGRAYPPAPPLGTPNAFPPAMLPGTPSAFPAPWAPPWGPPPPPGAFPRPMPIPIA